MQTSNGELIRFQNVGAGYGRHKVLQNVSFGVGRGDYLALVGSNGAGKTTLLRTLLGLLPVLDGQIAFPSGKVCFGYVPQLAAVDEIFPFSALEIVLMGRFGRLGALKKPSQSDKKRALEALEEVGIAQCAQKLLRELSGGQKQRVLIARALVGEPDVLVLDEHTNNLDIAGEKAIMALVDEVHAHHKIAVVMVSHSLNTVANHARHIAIIREGRFDFAPVETVMQTDYLREFYGVEMQVLEVGGRRVVL